MSIDSILDDVLAAEGGYVNDPADAGGETNWGITVAVARQSGYKGAMRDLPKATARDIYRQRYVIDPGFAAIATVSEPIAAELVDTGVNMGPQTAGKFLQRALNALNDGGATYADVAADGAVGPATMAALRRYLQARGKPGEVVMLRALNALQGTRYIELAEARPANERFVYGWILNRVAI